MKDQSFTCLAGRSVKKSVEILELLGDLDELNCVVGLAKTFSSEKIIIERLDRLQEDLFRVSGRIAGAGVVFDFLQKTRELEEEIERQRDTDLKEFVKLGKDKTSAFLHLARAVCRRAERRAVSLNTFHLRGANFVTSEVRKGEGEEHLEGGREQGGSGSCEMVSLVAYLNRLSGLLFWLAEGKGKK